MSTKDAYYSNPQHAGQRSGGFTRKRKTILATFTMALAAFGATAVPAGAAVNSASINGTIATVNLDGADNNETVSVSGGLLVHTGTGGGLNSSSDWDSATPGDQTVPANGTFTIVVNGGAGNDSITVLAKNTEIAEAKLFGGGGDDVLTGADTNDFLEGGEGNDRLVGGKGTDAMNGGSGNDTLVWNNGDGSDRINGDAGNDVTEVNGSATLGDEFTLDPEPGGVKFQRTNLVPFTLDTATERFQVNGLGGNDSITAHDGVGALTLLSVDGGAGNDTVNGSDGPDLIVGADGNDILNGGGGDDRIIGGTGADTMNGGSGDDTLVWNNGDGSDVLNGDAGNDDVEVNGSPIAGDVFTVQPNGGRIKFDRTNLVPFSLDIGSSETTHANGLGGDDTITVGDVGSYSVTASGGAGNDTLIGGSSSETFVGGSGNDTINPGGGHDVVFGGEGDDTVNIRDHTADLAFGGDGNDTVVADNGNVDTVEAFERVDRTPNDTPPPFATPPPVVTPPPAVKPPHDDASTRPVTIRGGIVKAIKGTVSIRVSCPASSPRNCTGTLTLHTARGATAAGRTVALQLGSTRYNVAPGVSKTLKVKLAHNGRRLADRRGHLKVLAVSSTGRSGKVAQNSQRITLAIGAATKRG
jgi:Ca2+-binding RTX toxin-like protein